ncbi:glycine amidinotransferase, partial [Paragonimus westermani]
SRRVLNPLCAQPIRRFRPTTSSYVSGSTTTQDTSPVNSWNEWDPLEEVIIGTPEYATVPKLLPEVKACSTRSNWEFYQKNGGRYWADVIPREHWDLLVKQVEEYARILEQEGVKVVRPQAVDHASAYKLLGFESQGFYAAMPRDFLLVVGDELIEASMAWRSRYFDFVAYRPLILDYWRRGAKWTVAPKPTDFKKLIDESVSQRLDAGTSDKSQIGTVTTESEPCFDAADFIRAGRDIFGQRSQ